MGGSDASIRLIVDDGAHILSLCSDVEEQAGVEVHSPGMKVSVWMPLSGIRRLVDVLNEAERRLVICLDQKGAGRGK